MAITEVNHDELDRLITIWDTSVRATHHFLSEKDILSLRKLIRECYFAMVELRVYRDQQNQIQGFIGVVENRVEMLFIAPSHHRQGIGRQLLVYAITQLQVDELDVNEQNPRAVEFYKKMGFEITGRTEQDGQGRPFPLLQMKLTPVN